MEYLISPSLLAANQLNLQADILKLKNADISMLHLDIFDNHFAPNLSFGPDLCNQIKTQFPDLQIDVHLMTYFVDNLIEKFASNGANRISIHPEAVVHLDRSLNLIKNLNCQSGLVLNPTTDPSILQWCHHLLDFVLVMTVNPGFSGQKYIPEMIEKIKWINKSYPQLAICADGGINKNNLADLAKAGVSQFIIGAAIFNEHNLENEIKNFQAILKTI